MLAARLFALPIALALSASPALASRGAASSVADGAKKATKESVTKKRDAVALVRDRLSELIGKPAPKGLSTDEKQAYERFVADTRVIIDGCDALQKKLSEGLKNSKADLDQLTELGETESTRLQMAMDRLAKSLSALGNVLKKIGDTAESITQNLK